MEVLLFVSICDIDLYQVRILVPSDLAVSSGDL